MPELVMVCITLLWVSINTSIGGIISKTLPAAEAPVLSMVPEST